MKAQREIFLRAYVCRFLLSPVSNIVEKVMGKVSRTEKGTNSPRQSRITRRLHITGYKSH